MAQHLPNASALFELHEHIVNKRLDDGRMYDDDHPLAYPQRSATAAKYRQWRLCDDALSKYKEVARSGQHKQQQNAYIEAVLCTGSALAPKITAQWFHCLKRQEAQGQCALVTRLLERSLRVEGQALLRHMAPEFHPTTL
ncbi:hypothetical protein SPRG_02797 [Saprolegnia parasitica CBS 223.65]|uniref:Uncharacterized protein n=1 Tax=Saprolegnia parasitica (strain CBS 223.65) TaxID=695850 RepID=A0A067CPA2_SAPPC|nr:hypothetical protein SPRG_02797 [Saprolegnia parasitica CBS 223.65]KDO32318.1 hypothetical protein SPRG_02797 [Saprolegnia parasitica CBS 223.65]|eukprot:XP_012196774.1 hypothetical protein SPRG_02797 [Saprolegnia parasitica CBS 223.65]